VPIPDHLVEQVRQQADLVEIVSEHTRLKRSGKTFRGPCPLHGGEGNNFSVDPAKGYYKCFVCGEGGTVFTFLMKHLGMSYPEAIRTVAERVGIEIPDERARRQEVDPNQPLYEVNAFAADWFRKRLWDDERGKAGARVPGAARDHPRDGGALRAGVGARGVDRAGRGRAQARHRQRAPAGARPGQGVEERA
jgi:DNA primase